MLAWNNVKELHVSGYDILNFDVNITLTDNHLAHLDVSDNKLANIGSNIFPELQILESLDLGQN